MLHFIRHSFLGGIATRSGLIITLGALLIAGGFFALLWFGLAIYAAVAIGVLLVLLAAALTRQCFFSRIPSVLLDLVLYWESKVAKPVAEFIDKLRYPYAPLFLKRLSDIGCFLLRFSFAVLVHLPFCLIIVLLIVCIVSLMAIPLAFLLSPLLMTFLAFASSISLASFILALLEFIGITFTLGVMLIFLNILYFCIMETKDMGAMFYVGACFLGVALWGILTVLLLIPTGVFVVYLLPSLISALTFTIPVWASCVGMALLFGLALCGVLLYARQAVLDYRLRCLVETSGDQPLAIASIKSLLEQGAMLQQGSTLKQGPALRGHQLCTRGAAEDIAYQTVLTHFFLHFFKRVFDKRDRSHGRENYDASIISNAALPLVWLCLTRGVPDVKREYRGHAINAIIAKNVAKNVETSEADKKLLLVKLLFECGEKYPEFYRNIKEALSEFVGMFVADHFISPFLFIGSEVGESFEKRLSDAEEILYSGETGLKYGGVFYQKERNDWFISYYRDGCQHKKITSPEHIEKLNEHAKYLSSVDEDKKLEASQALQRMTQSMGISIPLCDWTQAAKDMLYYAVKSDLLSDEDLEALLADCSKPPNVLWFRCLDPNEDKKAALKELIASFKVNREDLLAGLPGITALPADIAGLIVGYCQPYANPDERALPVEDPDAVAATPGVG